MYDLHNKILLKEKPTIAEGFGVKGLGVVFENKVDAGLFDKIIKGLRGSGAQGLRDIIPIVEIRAKRASELKTAVKRVRNQAVVVMVDAADVSVARAAAEMSDVDIISHAFVDQTTARDAAANNVALEVNLRDILNVYGMKRANLLSKLNFNLRLARKYKTPIVLTTGARTIYEMRTPKQIQLFAQAIGFTNVEAKKAIFTTPKKIVETNRKKLDGKIVSEGVEIRGSGSPGRRGSEVKT